ELGGTTWKLGFTTGAAQRPRERHVPAGDGLTVLEERRRAKSRCGVPEEARVVRCDEAGQAGVWLPRFCVSHDGEHAMVDSASIAVDRRSCRAKADRRDARKLLTRLRRHPAEEKKAWSLVRVPRQPVPRVWPRRRAGPGGVSHRTQAYCSFTCPPLSARA